MKRKIFSVLAIAVLVVSLCSCAKKFSPDIKLNSENISSIDFKKTYFSEDNTREHMQKSVTEQADIKALTDWLSGLRLTEHPAIEIPAEKITYALVINGKKTHTVIFMGEYIIYDFTAYTFDNSSDLSAVETKYNLLGYTETEAELDLVK